VSKKTLQDLLNEANENIKRLTFDEANKLIKETSHIILDVREESEVFNLGKIKHAIHVPRGLIEFTFNSENLSNPENITIDTNILCYCAAGARSALAAQSLKRLGFKNVYNIGGYAEWIENGGEIEK